MEFSGTQTISVPIEQVWTYLADMRKVAKCGPGFQSLEQVGPERWRMLVAVKVGLMRVRFTMDVTRTVLQKPDLIAVKVRGNAPGSAMELEGRMHLTALDEKQTRMNWTAQVAVSGILANIGTHLMHDMADKLTRQFFTCLKTHLQTAGG